MERQLERIVARHAQLLSEVGGDNMARLGAQDIARLNKELSDLEPVVEALGQLRTKQAEASRSTSTWTSV